MKKKIEYAEEINLLNQIIESANVLHEYIGDLEYEDKHKNCKLKTMLGACNLILTTAEGLKPRP